MSDAYEPPEPSGAVGRYLDHDEIFTIGHSNHESGEFLTLLRDAEIKLLVDVRRYPGSRRSRWTNPKELEPLLAESSIEYLHLVELGGRRRPEAGSVNSGWRNKQFQGYADHMASPEFATDLHELTCKARARRTAMMCAEALWWRCHRRMLADALVVRGWRVVHIGSRGEESEHALTDFAVVKQDELIYSAEPGSAPPPPGVHLRAARA
jgi:uncharacterized protein (DUF488 family)